MAAAPPSQIMTAAELAALPEDGNLYELSRGMLVCMSPPPFGPSWIAGRAIVKLGSFVDEGDGSG